MSANISICPAWPAWPCLTGSRKQSCLCSEAIRWVKIQWPTGTWYFPQCLLVMLVSISNVSSREKCPRSPSSHRTTPRLWLVCCELSVCSVFISGSMLCFTLYGHRLSQYVISEIFGTKAFSMQWAEGKFTIDHKRVSVWFMPNCIFEK